MISKKINIIINLLLEYFIRLNFNRKKEKFKKIHKYDFVYFFNDTIAKEISIHGIYEKDEINILSKLVSKNDYVIDIGANIGNHSIRFSKIAKKVYSFEAHPKTFEILRFNCAEYKNISVFKVGISDKKSNLYFKNIKTSNIGGKKLDKNGTIKSQVNKLDNLIRLKKKVKLIKIDVEGHEFNALLGMKATLASNDSLLLLEFCEKTIYKRKRIINFLIKNKYSHSYCFTDNQNFSSHGYMNLISKIFWTIFQNEKRQNKIIQKLNLDDLIYDNYKGNIIFSKKKLNLERINF